MARPHNKLAATIGLCYAASFAMPALMLNNGEAWYGWQAFVYGAITAFPVWLANPLLVFGLASLAMQNWRGATIFGVLSCLGVALGVFLLIHTRTIPHVGFYLWGGSCIVLALVKLIALSIWPGIDTGSELPQPISEYDVNEA